MKNNLIILLFILFGLTACAISPQHLGFSKAEWENMDDAKRAELLQSYRQLHSNKNPSHHEEETVDSKVAIDVLVAEGKVMMPPFVDAYSYQPVSFRIQQGSCQQVLLEQISGKHKVKMEVCFKKGVLLVDPSHYDATKIEGSARLYRSPLWRNGFNYAHINTTGYVRLQDVTIRIHD